MENNATTLWAWVTEIPGGAIVAIGAILIALAGCADPPLPLRHSIVDRCNWHYTLERDRCEQSRIAPPPHAAF